MPSPPLMNARGDRETGKTDLSSNMAARSAFLATLWVCPAARWTLTKQTEESSMTQRATMAPYEVSALPRKPC